MAYGVGTDPVSLAVGDFNGDGKLDLAVAYYSSSTLTILLGEGNGAFKIGATYDVPGVDLVLAADFNGDGKLDLAVAKNFPYSIDLLLGNGDGTFQSPLDYGPDNGFDSTPFLAVGDFNNDGRLDLVVDGAYLYSQLTNVALSPTALTFSDQVVQTSSGHKTITFTDAGSFALKTTGVGITGANAGDFSQTNSCGAIVSPGAACTINVTFTPNHIGPRTAAVTIADNGIGTPQSISLSGTGVISGPNATLSTSALTFTTQLIGTTSTAQVVRLYNYGTNALTIAAIAISGTNAGDFLQTHTCGTSLAAGASCTISVSFKPAAAGTRTAALSITDNAAGSPQKMTLSGIGTAVKLSATSLSFGSVAVGTSSSSQTVTLTNVSTTTTLNITGITLTGIDPGDFVETNNCGSSVAAGKSCSISITFKPTATGTRMAALSIGDNGGSSPQSVQLSGSRTSGACAPYGTECGLLPCCPGLTRVPASTRAYCE